MMTINIIGCGKVGKTIGKLIYTSNAAKINAVLNTNLTNTLQSVQFIGDGNAVTQLENLPEADITFITAKDDKIKQICDQLVDLNKIKANSILIHCSGALSSAALSAASRVPCYSASIHPIKSFADPDQAVATFAGTYCSFEGNQTIFTAIQKLFTAIGGVVFQINKDDKIRYHAATVIANNYSVTLHHHATKLLSQSGVTSDIAMDIINKLMFDAITNIQAKGHINALTGPIQRGDTQTIECHLNALNSSSILKGIYLALGLGAVELTAHSDTIKADLVNQFTQSI